LQEPTRKLLEGSLATLYGWCRVRRPHSLPPASFGRKRTDFAQRPVAGCRYDPVMSTFSTARIWAGRTQKSQGPD